MEFKNCKLEVILAAQSPMVHFQADEEGAALRGSEVKPKFDKFLIRKAKEKGIKLSESAYLNTENKAKRALNYKVTIEAVGKKRVLDLFLRENKNKFAFIFGDRKKKLILQDVKLSVLCMNERLQKLITDYIIEFFAVTNFGFRQDKGFGSFIPREYLNQKNKNKKELIEDISGWLKSSCESQKCYFMEFSENDKFGKMTVDGYNRCFKEMKDFYDLLKSGRNNTDEHKKNNEDANDNKESDEDTNDNKGNYSRSFIYQYMHKKGIGNEKAWMKRKGIAPILNIKKNVNPSEKDNNQPAKYVRALLGIGEQIEFINAKGKPAEKVRVRISHIPKNKGDKIQRMESPIYFKIVLNYVFICAKRIPKDIYDQQFKFESSIKRPGFGKRSEKIIMSHGDKGTLFVPSKQELDKVHFSIDDLLDHYVKYYNNEEPGEDGKFLRDEKITGLKNNKYVEEVK